MNYCYQTTRNIHALTDEDMYIDNIVQDKTGIPFKTETSGRQKKDDLCWRNQERLPRGGGIEFQP